MLRPIAIKVLRDTCTASNSLQHMPWRAAHVQGLLSNSGMRGGGLVLRGAKVLSCSHVAFKADGVTFPILCATTGDAQLLLKKLKTLKNGDYLVVTPPPSKSDQFGLIWGSLPIYAPFGSTGPLNAATLIQDLLLAFPPVCGQEQATPLF